MAATAYQSSQSNSGTSVSSLVVTKPASVAVGDFLIASVSLAFGGSISISTPSGWTVLLASTQYSGQGAAAIFWKIADSTDVAATNYTFSSSGTADVFSAAISRFNQENTTTPIDQSITSSGSSVTGITPTVSMGQFIMILCCLNSSGTTGSVAGYQITNNNTTWTEAYDAGGNSGSVKAGVAMAYANSTRLEATGTAQATLTSYTASYTALLNIVPTGLVAMSIASSSGTTSLRYSASSFSLLSTMNVPTISSIAAKWKTLSKNISTWINQTKS